MKQKRAIPALPITSTSLIAAALLVTTALALCSCRPQESAKPEAGDAARTPGPEIPVAPETPAAAEDQAVTEDQANYLSLVAAGDNLFHDVMIRPNRETQSYNFTACYSEIKPIVEPADIAFINQETPLGGEVYGFSGYPLFNTPQEVGNALKAAGFDVINHATNHSMDKGEGAVFATMDYWDSVPGIHYLGIHRSQENRDSKKVIIEKNGIKTGFLSYTYGTNGLPLPRDKPYLVSLINESVMEKEIKALRPLCDVLIVSMHWGVEYQHTVSGGQKRLSRFLADNQVDLVIGHHPHVLEPYEFLDRPDGQKTLCFYSLGNFISAQDTAPTQLGGIAFVRIKQCDEKITIEEAGIIPVVNHYENGLSGFKVYPLYSYTADLAKKHLLRLRGISITIPWLTALAEETLSGGNILLKNPFDKKAHS
ncbi:MAG: CapA family protein [Treponema sp.]|jgi:poly-gamma-glutamate synthesis protein (capsule biosynthesis protein)|nr:CapA family protein [Treponema sp.]